MKKKIQYIKINDSLEDKISMFPSNYSHVKFVSNGFVFSSNKRLGLPKVYLNREDVVFITWF